MNTKIYEGGAAASDEEAVDGAVNESHDYDNDGEEHDEYYGEK